MTTLYSQGHVFSNSAKESAPHLDRGHVRQQILDFFSARSASSLQPTRCPRCGQPMQYLDATFSVYGAEKQWNVRLPVCPCSTSSVSAAEATPGSTGKPHRRPKRKPGISEA